ncbi:hypothetical protein GCM10011297_11120 [Bacterioplanes sanyensis]|uniref:Hpt domain-containing protein n=1 Tax=Bacterioplanes sanyensis TaxID=1249553 RepID=UPI001671DDBB|nr:Hpt domain-containing protein [Bacterioplanes sanyensis]GGY39683.1 hypothetical protein GCM10011297_11120 [Bacterioplanes sanyensis]
MSELASHFDEEALDMLKEVMDEEFPELIAVFVRDSEQRLPLLQKAIELGNAGEVRELAHSFKGASSNISAQLLADHCFALEQAGRAQNLEHAPEQFEQVQTEYWQVKALLQQMLSK